MKGNRMIRGFAGLLALLLMLSVSGCGRKADPLTDEAALRAALKAGPPIPDWLEQAPAATRVVYLWAAAHHAEMQYIPCYCGCNAMGHTDNSSCYYTADASGTPVEWDPHATTCDICLQITRDLQAGLGKGKSLSQIRTEIDAKYQARGLPSTDTPKPPGK